jgi:hypothetical protein
VVGGLSGGGGGGPLVVHVTTRTEPVVLSLHDGGALRVIVTDGKSASPIQGASVELRGLVRLQGRTDAAGSVLLEGTGLGRSLLVVSAEGYAAVHRTIATSDEPAGTETQQVQLERGVAVSGTVIDSSGKPVANAAVVPMDVSDSATTLEDVGDAVSSDASGRWRFAALPRGTFQFHAQHETAGIGATAPVTVERERTGLEIRLDAGAVVSGRVVDGENRPVAGAVVRMARRLAKPWDLTWQAYTTADGSFSFRAVPRVEAQLVAQHQGASSEVITLSLSKNSPTDLVVKLTVTGSISGQVVSSKGQAIPEARVLAVPESKSGPEDYTSWRLRGPAADVAEQEGKFELRGLPQGRYMLRAVGPDQPESAIYSQPSTFAETGARNVRVVAVPAGAVVGKVKYSDGSVPLLYSVQLGGTHPTPFADPTGRFRVSSAGGKQNLHVSGPGFGAKLVPDIDVKPSGETDVGTITVEKGRTVSGIVLNSSGSPVPNAAVVAGRRIASTGTKLSQAQEGMAVQEGTSGADGTFVLSGFGDEPLVVAADHSDIGRSRAIPVPGGRDSVNVTLALLPTGSLSGKVMRQGAPVEQVIILAASQAASRSSAIASTGANGEYRFERLAPDQYLVSIMVGRGGGGPNDIFTTAIDVRSGTTTTHDIDVAAGSVDLRVFVGDTSGQKFSHAFVWLASGTISGSTYEEIWDAVANRGAGTFRNRVATGGRPAELRAITAGQYTVCVCPIPVDPSDATAMQKVSQQLNTMKFNCIPQDIAAAPAQQTVTIPYTGT